jgi:hypothetical protein
LGRRSNKVFSNSVGMVNDCSKISNAETETHSWLARESEKKTSWCGKGEK